MVTRSSSFAKRKEVSSFMEKGIIVCACVCYCDRLLLVFYFSPPDTLQTGELMHSVSNCA